MVENLDTEYIMQLKLVSKFFKGFADYNRICIFEALINGEKTVTEIMEITGFNQSKVSNHLKCLKECEIVELRQAGKYGYYSIRDERVKTIINLSKEVLENLSEEKYNCMKY